MWFIWYLRGVSRDCSLYSQVRNDYLSVSDDKNTEKCLEEVLKITYDILKLFLVCFNKLLMVASRSGLCNAEIHFPIPVHPKFYWKQLLRIQIVFQFVHLNTNNIMNLNIHFFISKCLWLICWGEEEMLVRSRDRTLDVLQRIPPVSNLYHWATPPGTVNLEEMHLLN